MPSHDHPPVNRINTTLHTRSDVSRRSESINQTYFPDLCGRYIKAGSIHHTNSAPPRLNPGHSVTCWLEVDTLSLITSGVCTLSQIGILWNVGQNIWTDVYIQIDYLTDHCYWPYSNKRPTDIIGTARSLSIYTYICMHFHLCIKLLKRCKRILCGQFKFLRLGVNRWCMN